MRLFGGCPQLGGALCAADVFVCGQFLRVQDSFAVMGNNDTATHSNRHKNNRPLCQELRRSSCAYRELLNV